MLLYAVRALAATRTQIYLTADQRKHLDELGRREGKTLAQLIREAVDRYLEQESKSKGDLQDKPVVINLSLVVLPPEDDIPEG